MEAVIKTITPSDASALLERNTNNRPINQAHVRALASEIRDGLWKLNGIPIIYNASRIIDGQHRLHACIEADKPFNTAVIDDAPNDIFDTIDTGRRRNGADVLHISGMQHAKTLAPAVLLIDGIYNEKVESRKKVPNTKIIELANKYPGVEASIEYIGNGCKLLPLRFFVAFHYVFTQVSPAQADKFFDDLINGVGLTYGDPVLTLRERLTENIATKKLTRTQIAGMMVKAWNMRMRGRLCFRMSFRSTGIHRERFNNIESPAAP